MAAALYHPQYGYYKQDTTPIGPQGDFFTAISATPVLGRVLAGFLLRARDRFAHAEPFVVVEFGGHRGQLRADVLAAAPDLDYRVIEAGDPWPDPFVGCLVSNEFLDALPVHRVAVREGRWVERVVGFAEDRFIWQDAPLSDPRLASALADLPVAHMEGHETEVNLEALDWMAAAGRHLRRGLVVTIDYGLERADYYSPQRPRGTLRCYRRHQLTDEPLQDVGSQDITAHVEFTSLMAAGRRAGLQPIRFTDLTHFLVEEGADIIREIGERTAGRPSRERQGLHQLLHPGLMGSAFRVLIQEKL